TVYDLGVVGQTYEIAEPDMLQSFYNKLRKAEAEGKMAEVEEDMKQRFIDHANRPKGIALPRAETHRVRYYDPSTVLSQDIVDHEGNVLWPAGTKVNPLEYIAMSQQWLFFDGNDPEQAAWARDYLQRYPNQVRPILVQGAVLALAKAWDTRLYFDQHGSYVKKFGIKAVPTLISQEGKKLRIDEVVPNG
ncbi:MAG: type-F conjugative transfer system protein TraW, partial [Candidatus Thiodiazotropha sp. 4PDIVS1]